MTHPASLSGLQHIEHVVVLMLENRSFDSMIGFLKERNPDIDGLTGKEYNPVSPADPSKGNVGVRRGARFFGDANPGHEPDRVERQLYGSIGSGKTQPTMDGFVADYLSQQPAGWTDAEKLEETRHIMDGFSPDQVPVFAKLAEEFVVCDRYFSSAPTSTFPNRAFLQTGTANGHFHSAASAGDPEFKEALFGNMYGTPTIYGKLSAAGIPWKIYHQDVVWSFIIPEIRKFPEHVVRFKQFKKDVKKDQLPAFSLIEPAYLNTPYHKASDDDAPHDIREGQRLAADVYNTLRSNPGVWNKTLLVIVYDEHGGYADHVPPPATVNPDGKNSPNPPFDFERLGVRVPAILVSPWLPRGVVDHTVYDHTSILKFVENRFGLTPLTERDARANTFDHDFALSGPREETPEKITPPPSGTEKNTDTRLYDPSEPQGVKAVLASFALGTGMKAAYYVISKARQTVNHVRHGIQALAGTATM